MAKPGALDQWFLVTKKVAVHDTRPCPVAAAAPPPRLQRFGLKVLPNAGAGDCGMLVTESMARKVPEYATLSAMDIRQKVADTLAADPAHFAPFAKDCMDYAAGDNGVGLVDEAAFAQYIAQTRKKGTFTDHAEWAAVRRALPRLPEFVFVRLVTSAHGDSLVQAHFGDVADDSCPGARYLLEHGVSAESIAALPQETEVVFSPERPLGISS